MDEPEALGAIGLAAREELDNLTFVINCNLQRLDGPVRGNGKIIQEKSRRPRRGAGRNVIRVIWGRDWDPLLAQDTDGVLVNKMNTTPDGQFQTDSVESGAYIRENFFGGDPRLRAMVAHLSVAPFPRAPCRAAGTTTARSYGVQGRARSTSASRPSSSPTRSRAGRSARTSRRATPPTR